MTVEVLRLGHRPLRDKRITTHIGLVARAFGANKMVMPKEDEKITQSVESLVENWGGDFSVEEASDWKSYVKSFEGSVVHLTMYGMPVDEAIEDITGDVLIVVGSEKVPPEVFDIADYNISIGNQPHSEVSALAIFLDRFFGGAPLKRDFGGKLKIEPSTSSKIVKSK